MVTEELRHGPAFSVLNCKLPPGVTVKAESGAMVCMQDVVVDTRLGGPLDGQQQAGCLSSLMRALLGSQSLFSTTFTGGPNGGWVWLGPQDAGDIQVVDLRGGQNIYIQRGSLLGSWSNVETETKSLGVKGLLSGEGVFFLRAYTQDGKNGKVYLSSYGGIEKFLVKAGQELIVDTGHVVAYEDSLHFKVDKFGADLKSMFLSGEGLVCKFRVRDLGSGTRDGFVWIQTRTPNHVYVPTKKD